MRALRNLGSTEAAVGSPDADRISAEALTLGQALGVSDRQLSDLFATRGYYVLLVTDPAAAAQTARAAAGHLRRAGDRAALATAIVNLAMALITLGDWDAADAELTRAADSDTLTDIEFFSCQRAWLAALRGDASAAQMTLEGLESLRASEDPQDRGLISMAEGFTADARRQPHDALRHARAALSHLEVLGISHDCARWAWPLAARAAHGLNDTTTTGDLLALLDSSQPGHLPPMLRAERDLARARLSAGEDAPAAAAAFAAAVGGLRELSTPYHLAHGLLDHAGYLIRRGDAEAAAAAIGEASDIARKLRCQPLPDRAADTAPAQSAIQE